MLKKELTDAIITRLHQNIPYNINIMNEYGIIQSSTDLERVGSYHSVAHKIIIENENIEVIEEQEILPKGTKPGVNLPIRYKQFNIGVIGVTGEPKKVLPIAYTLKISVEAMIEQEILKEQRQSNIDRKRTFINHLLSDDFKSNLDLEMISKSLGFDPSLFRVPLLGEFSNNDEAEIFLSLFDNPSNKDNQDIYFITHDNSFLIFKHIDLDNQFFYEKFKNKIREFIQGIYSGIQCDKPIRWFVGPGIVQLGHYGGGYRKVLWLRNLNKKTEPSDNLFSVYFFYDNTSKYFTSLIPGNELLETFYSWSGVSSEFIRNNGLETINALINSNFNISETASLLGVHRNTITRRLEKIYESLGIDPLQNPSKNDIIFYLMRFLEFDDTERFAPSQPK